MTMSLDDHESAPGAQTGRARQQCIYSLLRGYAVSFKKTHPVRTSCITLRPESKTPDLNILNFSDRYILAIPVYIKALRKYYIKLK